MPTGVVHVLLQSKKDWIVFSQEVGAVSPLIDRICRVIQLEQRLVGLAMRNGKSRFRRWISHAYLLQFEVNWDGSTTSDVHYFTA